MSFYVWLVDQKDRFDPIGDLAKDLLRDGTLKGHDPDYWGIRLHLKSRSAGNESLFALVQAWEEYRRPPSWLE